MSDAAKSPAEIEDVLSSVRRLVSDQPAPDRLTDKLVLTPALRVTEPEDPWATVTATDEADADDLTDPAEGSEHTLRFSPNDRLSDWGEVTPISHVPLDSPAEPAATFEDLSSEQPRPADGFESETGDEDWPRPGAEQALQFLFATRNGQRGAIETDEADEPGNGDIDDHATAAEEVFDADHSQRDEASQAVDDEPEPAADPMMSAAPDMPETPSEPEVDTDASTGTFGQDEVGQLAEDDASPHADAGHVTELSNAAETWDHEPVSEVETDETESGAYDEAANDFAFGLTDDQDAVLDEDTLREMIVEIIREELQGALGQRITRNVRKMVRREIRLALAAEDLD